jgi:chaperone modulatory protein CbpM
MMAFSEVIALFSDLEAGELTAWIERGWVQPERDAGGLWSFREIDVARVRLVYDLHRTFEPHEDTLALLLALLDQVYDLRREVKALTGALEAQSPPLRAAILDAYRAIIEAR